jgi:UDP-N-acetylglucosamine transferase subunit ALG13
MFIGKTGNQDAIIQYGRSKAKEVYYIAFLEFIKWYNSQKN